MILTSFSTRKIYAGYTQIVSFALENDSDETVSLNFQVRYFDASGATLLAQNNALDYETGLYAYEVGANLPDLAVSATARLLFGEVEIFAERFAVVRSCFNVVRFLNKIGGVETYGFSYKAERAQLKRKNQFTPVAKVQDIILDIESQPVLVLADLVPDADLKPLAQIVTSRSIALLEPFALLTCRADSFVYEGKIAENAISIEFNLPYENA